MNLVEIRAINVDNPTWVERLRAFCLKILHEIGKEHWSISVVLCDDDFIRQLNQTYREKDSATDVLSFPQGSISTDAVGLQEELGVTAGDIVVSLDCMRKNAREFKTTETDEIARLIVHGILHLNGMDHEEDAVSGPMLDLQDRLLQKYRGEF